jgi:hypothetical protein
MVSANKKKKYVTPSVIDYNSQNPYHYRTGMASSVVSGVVSGVVGALVGAALTKGYC